MDLEPQNYAEVPVQYVYEVPVQKVYVDNLGYKAELQNMKSKITHDYERKVKEIE